jgi:hypothetical protein
MCDKKIPLYNNIPPTPEDLKKSIIKYYGALLAFEGKNPSMSDEDVLYWSNWGDYRQSEIWSHVFVVAQEQQWPVEINFSTETGEGLYAVSLSDTEWWLNAFPTEEEAVKFCKQHNLNLRDM